MTTRYEGGLFDDRTLAMYHEVERLCAAKGLQIFVAQGGFNAGGVAASAGTHDRAAVDVSGSILSPDERWTVVTAMRRVGFAAWIRTPAEGFAWHIHGVPINGDLSTAARAQVVQYSKHQNGLAGAGPDDGPTGYYDATWEKYSGSSAYRPPINTNGTSEEDSLPFTEADIRRFIAEEATKVSRSESYSGAADLGRGWTGHYTVGDTIRAIVVEEVGHLLDVTGVLDKLDLLLKAEQLQTTSNGQPVAAVLASAQAVTDAKADGQAPA